MIPPPPVVPPPEPQTQTARTVAVLLILSTPISGIVTFALVAILFGEDRLETGSGLTSSGAVAYAIPAILGLGLLLWSISTVPFPRPRVIAGTLCVLALIFVAIGLRSSQQSAELGDPSIGGPLLVFFALPMLATALVLWVRSR